MKPEEQVSAGTREAVGSARRGAFLTLVIPTRNEAKNVPRLVRGLEEALSGGGGGGRGSREEGRLPDAGNPDAQRGEERPPSGAGARRVVVGGGLPDRLR